jgi:PLP dependent protein
VATELAKDISTQCPRLHIDGLMTIGAPGDSACFDQLVSCREEVARALGREPASLQLSMGMSGDYEEAIARGSTSVRVGSSIFGAREYPNKEPPQK